MDPLHDGVTRAGVSEALRRFPRQPADRPELKAAAVAIALIGDGRSFLLTRRATTLRGHAGQWALPGGRMEPGETHGETARRELGEELGLVLGPEAELGFLDDYATRSGYVITPVVLWVGEAGALTPAPQEVASVHVVPLSELDVDAQLVTIPESDAPVIRLPLFGDYLHAPTAALLHQFREVALHGRSTRVAHYEQPVFAWQ